jgi:hypothetical protein
VIEQFILSVLTTTTAVIILVGLAVWLFRSLISTRLAAAVTAEYSRQLESHKADLRKDTETALETVKSRLSILAFERQTIFEALHAQRATVIAETYAKLKTLFIAVEQYTQQFEPAGGPTKDERHTRVLEAHSALRDYYPTKLIFLPKGAADAVIQTDLMLVQVANQFFFSVHIGNDPNLSTRWIQILEKLNTDVSGTLTSLEDEFRRLLGENG